VVDGIHGGGRPPAEGIENGGEAFLVDGREFREGKDEVLANLAQENAARERGVVLE
jgi:hypothetical protein